MIRNPTIPFIFALIFLCCCWFSCSLRQVSINVLMPSDNRMPKTITKLSVLPVIIQPDHFDSLRYFLPPDSAVRSIKTEYLAGIYDVLVESPALKRVVFSDTSKGNSGKSGRLYWEDLRTLCSHDSTQHVLVLTKSVLYDYPFIEKEVSYSWMDYFLFNKTKWAIFDPFIEQPVAIIHYSDTLQVHGGFVSFEIAEILKAACYQEGQKIGQQLVPYWIQVDRAFFSGPGHYMRKAGKLATNGNWNQAAQIWNVMADEENSRIASRAAFNLALTYEMDDIMDQAILWIDYADSLTNDTIISSYHHILQERLKQKSKLDQQFE